MSRDGQMMRKANASRTRNETERVRRIYDKMAANYDRIMCLAEQVFFGDGRNWVCARAYGTVLEIAIGTGRNLPYYRTDIRLVGIDLSEAMLRIAQDRVHTGGGAVGLCVGDAQALAFPDAFFDTVVATLAFCTIPDESQALAEAKRVLRPGGRLLLLEHVGSPRVAVRAIQRALEPLAIALQADHLLREPLDHLLATGFTIERLERSRWGVVERLAARKPS